MKQLLKAAGNAPDRFSQLEGAMSLMRNEKGHIHLYAIAGIALVLIIAYGLINNYMGTSGKSAHRSQGVLYDQEQAEYAQDGAVGDQRLNEMLYDIADTQSRLLRIKVECIALSWPSLNKDAQFRVLRAFRGDTEKQQAKVTVFLNRFSSPEWRQSPVKREKHLADLAQSISEEQNNLVKLIDEYSASLLRAAK